MLRSACSAATTRSAGLGARAPGWQRQARGIAGLLEDMRRRLRRLVPFIEKGKRKIVYPHFEDTLDEVTEVEVAGMPAAIADIR